MTSERHPARTAKRFATRSFFVVVFLLIAIITLLPFVWGLLTSIKDNREIFSFPPKLYGFTATFEHYIDVFQSAFFRSMLITVFYSAASIVCGLVIGLMMAYAIKRCLFP